MHFLYSFTFWGHSVTLFYGMTHVMGVTLVTNVTPVTYMKAEMVGVLSLF
jgi:hypothetical protein